MQEEGFDVPDDTKDRLTNFLEGAEVMKTLNKLDPKYRQAVAMRYIDNLSPKEIAEAIGETENNVSVRIHRGLEQIRKISHD